MINNRISNNTSIANEEYYTLKQIHKQRASWDIPCDFYIPQAYYTKDAFVISKERTYHGIQLGITILQERYREMVANIDFTKWVVPCIGRYSLNFTEFHAAFDYHRERQIA